MRKELNEIRNQQIKDKQDYAYHNLNDEKKFFEKLSKSMQSSMQEEQQLMKD